MIDAPRFAADLSGWYAVSSADLPWRRTRDPYHVWLSEIMLQQTQVTTVIPYFQRFTAAYPTIGALAAAPLDDVLKRWEGLGYYSRARNLHRAAREVAAKHEGMLPNSAAALQKLPGIGRYTANAIASIAFGAHVAVLDGNVIRVLTRLYDISADIKAAATQKRLWALAEGLLRGVPSGGAGGHNQAMMELGREVCKPRRPLCAACPVNTYCVAYHNGTQAERPVKRRKPTVPHHDIAAVWLANADGQILITQRPLDGLLGGLWEFPAARCLPGEPPEARAVRLLRDELDVNAEVHGLLCEVKHAFTHFRITLHAFECRHMARAPKFGQWVAPESLEDYAFPRAERQVITFWAGRVNRLF
jgi:A/G-specific adenine glycosylase